MNIFQNLIRLIKRIFLAFLLLTFFLEAAELQKLTLDEKIGQLLLVHFNGEEANEEAAFLIKELQVGGIVYYNWANRLEDPEQVKKLSSDLQQLASQTPKKIPLFIAVDQEGGVVNRLKNGFTQFPGNYALGRTENYFWGEEAARVMGDELKTVGVNLNFAPVIDVYTEPKNPVIGIRSFSNDPKKVTTWGEAAQKGYQRAGIIPVLKHFPGHGDVTKDSHEDLPTISKNLNQINEIELYPFRELASQADMMMTAHLMVPALDPKNCITYSKKAITDLLRNQLKFNGVIVTDSLAMQGAFVQSSSLEESLLKSLEAGHDLLLLGGKQLLASQTGFEFSVKDIKQAKEFLIKAVREGKISEDRIDESVARILALKEKYRLEKCCSLRTIDKTNSGLLAKKIAENALKPIKGDHFQIDDSFQIVAPESLREDLKQTDWNQYPILFFKRADEIEIKKDKICLFSYNAWKSVDMISWFQKSKKDKYIALIVVRDPIDADIFQDADFILNTYSPVPCSLQAAHEFLKR